MHALLQDLHRHPLVTALSCLAPDSSELAAQVCPAHAVLQDLHRMPPLLHDLRRKPLLTALSCLTLDSSELAAKVNSVHAILQHCTGSRCSLQCLVLTLDSQETCRQHSSSVLPTTFRAWDSWRGPLACF